MNIGTGLDRLAAVEALIDTSASGQVHPRAAVFLLRRALEERLDAYIAANEPGLSRCRTETKAVWLAHRLTPGLAGRFAGVWHALCGASHFHQSALPPTAAELRSWHEDVAFVLSAIRAPTAPNS
ncbi:hypothetical protein ACEZDB_00840 [Streptacidiphilus sp. N1-3]|uniref:SAV-6107-like HEPN domain-containing protein n=1 Tax=Streptacidiphilus alkalitolerans TaxID=3342712 RepID=A0ABV6WT43_9ACTN